MAGGFPTDFTCCGTPYRGNFIENDVELVALFGKTFCQNFRIPDGAIRSGNEVVAPDTFNPGKDYQVLVNQEWCLVHDVTLIDKGMIVTYMSSNVSKKTFMFPSMKWDLIF